MSAAVVKTISFMPRREGMTREEFATYYETAHAKLAIPLFPFSRYRRNHLSDPAAEPGFDCVSEFWFASLAEIGELMAGEIGDTMRADERKFLDRPRINAALANPVADGSDAGRTLALIRDYGGERAALIAAARRAEASLDLLSSMDHRTPLFDAILRCDDAVPPLPEGWTVAETLRVKPCETGPAVLKL